MAYQKKPSFASIDLKQFIIIGQYLLGINLQNDD